MTEPSRELPQTALPDANEAQFMATQRKGLRMFGRTGFEVSPICVGASGWGPKRDGESTAERDERIGRLASTVLAGERTVNDSTVNYIDTSNIYGRGESEALIGAALKATGGIPSGFVVQTKLDRNLATNDFSAAEMQRSLEESLTRLGLDRLQILFLHDPENIGFDASMAAGGPVEALVKMKDAGLASAIGISGGPVGMLQQFVETDLFDALVTHNRFTLVDRSASALFDAATERNLGINNAAPYGGGALSGRPGTRDRYGYWPIRPEVRASIDAMAQLCDDADVPLRAAALQFSMRDPRIHSSIVGTSSLERLDEALEDAAVHIPDDLWAELDRHLPPAASALDA
ncbi:MAG TPA: aldo/keto reductase [Microbacteriaceae bacterium]|nr:aldo/keto reductase [Microbacteriaceae bacterium]